MGTRHLIIIYYQGAIVLAQYGQWDGYPDGQGVKIVQFLRTPDNLARLKQGVAHIYEPSADEKRTIRTVLAQVEAEIRSDFHGSHRFRMGDFQTKLFPSLSRDTGAGILEIVAAATEEKRVPIEMDTEFVYDFLFCEWAYVIDLDEEVLEVYQGGERENEASSKRFKDVDSRDGLEGMVPSLVTSLPLGELPETDDEFIKIVNKDLGKRTGWDEQEEE